MEAGWDISLLKWFKNTCAFGKQQITTKVSGKGKCWYPYLYNGCEIHLSSKGFPMFCR